MVVGNSELRFQMVLGDKVEITVLPYVSNVWFYVNKKNERTKENMVATKRNLICKKKITHASQSSTKKIVKNITQADKQMVKKRTEQKKVANRLYPAKRHKEN